MFTLTVKNGAGAIEGKQEFDSGSFVIGRDDTCDISIVSPGVSRKHARIFTQQDRCFIEDLASSNGVIVDGQRVVGQRDLGTASQIQIGEHLLFLHHSNERFDIGATLFVSDDDQHCKLVRINDAFAGEVYNLSETTNTIGRIDENFILLSDHSISRHHAQIIRTGFLYNLNDLKSSNGTKLNGKKIKKMVELHPNDRIEFGNLQFVFATGGSEVALHDYRDESRSPLPYIIVGALVALAVLFLIFYTSGEEQTIAKAPTVEVESPDVIKAKAMDFINQKNYSEAIPLLRAFLATSSNKTVANNLLEQTIKEEKAAKILADSNDLIEQGEYARAADLLGTVPEETTSFKPAAVQLAKVNKTQAFRYKSDADKYALEGTRKSLPEAHYALGKALDLRPTEMDWIKEIRRIEASLKRQKIYFRKWNQKKESKETKN